MDNSR